jgi:hypothetical protein
LPGKAAFTSAPNARIEQSRFAQPGFAEDGENTAVTGLELLQTSVDDLNFSLPPNKHDVHAAGAAKAMGTFADSPM